MRQSRGAGRNLGGKDEGRLGGSTAGHREHHHRDSHRRGLKSCAQKIHLYLVQEPRGLS